jgi:hypothetical protein
MTYRNLGRVVLFSAFFLVLGLVVLPPTYGLLIQDSNSTLSIDPTTQHGVYDWIIDGVNLAPVYGALGGDDDYRQWFWYRVGNNPEASIDTLTLDVAAASDANFDGTNDTAFLRYLGAGFKIEVTLSLVGGTTGSGQSDIGEQIKIVNTSASPLTMSFYQYVDFQLNAPNVAGEYVWWMNSNTVREQGNVGYVTETVYTPVATHTEAEPFATTINKLNDGVASNLADTNSAWGDVTWANQWDRTIDPGGSFLISKDKQAVVPEPSTVLLVVGGLIGLLVGSRRRR